MRKFALRGASVPSSALARQFSPMRIFDLFLMSTRDRGSHQRHLRTFSRGAPLVRADFSPICIYVALRQREFGFGNSGHIFKGSTAEEGGPGGTSGALAYVWLACEWVC